MVRAVDSARAPVRVQALERVLASG